MRRAERNPENDMDEILNRGFRYALSLTHDEPLAEDLLQEACTRLLRSGKSWQPGYLMATIRNRFIDLYRRQQRYPTDSADDPALPQALEKIGNPHQEEHFVIESAVLEKALGRIRFEEREALYLSVVEGYTAREIAGLTRKPRNTVLTLIHRAQARLRKLLSGEAK